MWFGGGADECGPLTNWAINLAVIRSASPGQRRDLSGAVTLRTLYQSLDATNGARVFLPLTIHTDL